MKKIGIDARLIGQTGVGVYISNLLYDLQSLETSGYCFYIYLLKKDINRFNFNSKNFIKRKADYLWHSFSEQIGFLNRLYRDNLDLMHFTYFSYPLLYKRRFIATVHDLTPLKFKTGKASSRSTIEYNIKHFFYKKVIASQVNNAVSIITPSKSVKKQVEKEFGKVNNKKIFSIYEGVNYKLKKTVENKKLKEEFSSPFFIYVGNFYPHKNVDNLVQAFSKIKTDKKLILIGPDDFFSIELSQLINDLKQKERIKFYFDPKLKDLVFFYKNAQALINPSLSEGFGLPLIEALYFNCPIIASKIPVFQELYQNKFVSFNPQNIDDIVEKLNNFLKRQPQEKDYSKIIEKFSFKKMAKETLGLYKKGLTSGFKEFF